MGKRFGDNAYSVEELIAELTAAFTLAHLGMSSEPRPDHAQYIASWLKVLKADKRAILATVPEAEIGMSSECAWMAASTLRETAS